MDFQLELIGSPISLLMGVEEQCTPLCRTFTKPLFEGWKAVNLHLKKISTPLRLAVFLCTRRQCQPGLIDSCRIQQIPR